jgi:hypothetical protein
MSFYRDIEINQKMELADGMIWYFKRTDLQRYLKRKYVRDVLYYMISMDGMGLLDDGIGYDFQYKRNNYLQTCYFNFLIFLMDYYNPARKISIKKFYTILKKLMWFSRCLQLVERDRIYVYPYQDLNEIEFIQKKGKGATVSKRKKQGFISHEVVSREVINKVSVTFDKGGLHFVQPLFLL